MYALSLSKEYNFQISNVVDKNNEYHLWMTSIALAHSDLMNINKEIYRILYDDKYECTKAKKRNVFYYFKINIGFINETYDLLIDIKDYHKEIYSRLIKVNRFNQLFNEIENIMESKTSDFKKVKNLICKSRNKIFHYKRNDKDIEELKKVLETMKEHKIRSFCKYSDDFLNDNSSFAEEIQFNVFCDFYKLQNNEEEINIIINELLQITAKFLILLRDIILDFLNSIGVNNYYTITKKD